MSRLTHGQRTNGSLRESDRLRRDINTSERRLADLLGELDRRRREAFDVRLQAERHPLAFAVGAALAVGAVAGGVALAISRVRRRRRLRRLPMARVRRLWQASRRPEPAPAVLSSSVLGRIIPVLVSGAMSILVHRLGGRSGSRRTND